ncbi:hypothetical protein AB0J71_39400 [Nonomuraea sp. NPDC049637]|uniref:hypothetical protein n=1 Tax=Nonomuraea sp. NPDC049637 TaxID=3154356 RepID=UPI003448A51E
MMHDLCDRLVARLVPRLTAAASNCWDEINGRYCRRCCVYSTGTRCNGWTLC